MNPLIIIILVVAVVGIVGFARIAAKKTGFRAALVCTVDQVPAVFERLEHEGGNGSFAAFMPAPPDPSKPDDTLNIQFSIEDGRIGLDWCLLAPTNNRDKEKFEQFSSQRGYSPRLKEMNGVKYLRIDQGDVVALCTKVLKEMYSQEAGSKLEMVIDGFSWP